MASSSTGVSSSTNSKTLWRNRILSSKLYFNVPLSKLPLIYSPSYNIQFLGIEKLYLFDSSKWGCICRFLIMDGVLGKNRIVEPLKATKDDLLVVHSESYLNSLKSGVNVSVIVEVPLVALLPNFLVQQKVLHPFLKQVGGSILAAKLAKERGWHINVGGGFHHYSGDKGGGFCVYVDISLCVQYAFTRLNISRVMIIDLDAHQGNGHEKDFSHDRRVYILDMYNPGIYPLDYEARRYISQKVEVVVAGRMFDPELVVYNAGTDILDGDPLGRLKYGCEGDFEIGDVLHALNLCNQAVTWKDEVPLPFRKGRGLPYLGVTSPGGTSANESPVLATFIENPLGRSLIKHPRLPDQKIGLY
ncbi:hypothetical protein ACSBR2_040171 [Camellia fascicularis]